MLADMLRRAKTKEDREKDRKGVEEGTARLGEWGQVKEKVANERRSKRVDGGASGKEGLRGKQLGRMHAI